jgi:hypothetical protein
MDYACSSSFAQKRRGQILKLETLKTELHCAAWRTPLCKVPVGVLIFGCRFMADSASQFGQDRFVAEELFCGRRGGFFVEAGAGDGLWISNTLLLEQQYNWTGILIESTSA